MIVDPISNIGITEASNSVSYLTYYVGSEAQKQRRDTALVDGGASSKSSTTADTLELSSEAASSMNIIDSNYTTSQKSLLSRNSPIYKSQSAFKSILENKMELSENELVQNMDARKKAYQTSSENSTAQTYSENVSSGGYILTIPLEHLAEMRNYQSSSAKNKLYNKFNSGQEAKTGSLVDITA
jgi:hypothetical protein